MKTLQEEVSTLRTAIDRAQAFINRKATLASEQNRLIADHDLSLDLKSCSRLADLQAAAALAEAVEPRVLDGLDACIGPANNAAVRASEEVMRAHESLDAAMTKRLEGELPEDLDDVDVLRSSKAYKAELKLRHSAQQQFSRQPGTGSEIGPTITTLTMFANHIESCLAELVRVEQVRRKYTTATRTDA